MRASRPRPEASAVHVAEGTILADGTACEWALCGAAGAQLGSPTEATCEDCLRHLVASRIISAATLAWGPPDLISKEHAMRRYSKGASKDVERAMHKEKRGTLKSGSGKKVTSRKQAIAIGLSEARTKGKRVPRKKAS